VTCLPRVRGVSPGHLTSPGRGPRMTRYVLANAQALARYRLDWFPSRTALTVSSPEASTRHHAGVAVSGLFGVDLSSAEPPMLSHRAEIDREQPFPEGCPGPAAGSNDISDDDHDAEPDDPIHLAQDV
jgi:hypothetical protein